MASLPIGILKEINGQAYVIGIDQARFMPKGAFFNIYAQLALPGTEEVMSFAAVDVAFSPGGIAAVAGFLPGRSGNHFAEGNRSGSNTTVNI